MVVPQSCGSQTWPRIRPACGKPLEQTEQERRADTEGESLRQNPGSLLPVAVTASAVLHALIGSPPFSWLPASGFLSTLFLTPWPSPHLQ